MTIEDSVRQLADRYAQELKKRMALRVDEMGSDNKSHYLLYRVLGISEAEGELIDIYQNKGRFLYKYAGTFLEQASFLCFKNQFPQATKAGVENTIGRRPKHFEIDCLIDDQALEIKWRDATTDGDHVTKEHTRIQAIKAYGYIPIRLMFYPPNRQQAIRIQSTLETNYRGVNGEYYSGDAAWEYLSQKTAIDLRAVLFEIAEQNLIRGEE